MKNQYDIIIVGLGPGEEAHLTRQAWDLLNTIPEIYLRTSDHPVIENLPDSLATKSFDFLYESGDDYAELYEEIAEEIVRLGKRDGGVVYGVPGDPLVAEATTALIRDKARESGLSLKIVPGLSFLEPVFHAVGEDPLPKLALVDALDLAGGYHPSFPPDYPALIAQVYSIHVASEVKLTLMAHYPDDHSVVLVHRAGLQDESVEKIPLYRIDHSRDIAALTCLFVPPLEEHTSMESFQDLIAHLRSPEGCPWDREQTHKTLRPYLLEETYETLEALDAGNQGDIEEELGDLLIQIVLHAQIATEEGEFTLASVINKVSKKLIYRHPHVFADVELADSDAVKLNWERLKHEERNRKPGPDFESSLAGVPQALPSLSVSDAYQKRAARVGFDWPAIDGVIDKIREELAEVLSAKDPDHRAAEIGDLLFAIVNLARWYDLDAESLLRETNARFRYRFNRIEQEAGRGGDQVSDLSLDQMEAIWEAAKATEEN